MCLRIMDNIFRFSDYDAFAYVASGIAAMTMCDVLIGTELVLTSGWSFSEGLLFLICAYVLGHLVAIPSSILFEGIMVRGWIGVPAGHLLGLSQSGRPKWLLRLLFRGYFARLTDELCTKILLPDSTSAKNSVDGVFWRAYEVARYTPVASARMDAFLKLYGFCRNLAFVAIVSSVASLLIEVISRKSIGWSDIVQGNFALSFVLLIVGVALFGRFLKFYRLYALEVLLAYAAASPSEGRQP